MLISGKRSFSRNDIEAETLLLAGLLHSKGVGDNATVALLMFNDTPFFSLAAACKLVGAYLVPLNWHLTRPELDYILADCGAGVLFGHSDLLANAGLSSTDTLAVISKPTPAECIAAYPKLASGRPAKGCSDWGSEVESVSPFDSAGATGNRGGIFYTSGTTGKPKGVMREPLDDETWARVTQRSEAGFGLTDLVAGEVNIVAGPLYHSAPNAHALIAWGKGASVILMPRFDAEAFLELAARHGMTHAHMVPTMFSRLLALPDSIREGFQTSALKCICHGAAPCPPDVKGQMIDWFGPVIREYYAGTETGIITTSSSEEWMRYPGSVGRPAAGVDVRVIDDEGRELPADHTGRLILCSNSTTSFVYRGREGRPYISGWEGYIFLGDVGHKNAQDFVFLTDRSSDIVISGGVNIYPAEIEMELAALPGVRDCAVFGVPVAELGEAIVAVVVANQGVTLDEQSLRDQLAPRLAGYKIPRRIVLVESLPREDSGKIRKRLLKADYETIFKQG